MEMKVDSFISIIAPVRNDEEIVASFITDTVTMLSENYTNYELIIIDDGSEDDTIGVVSQLLGKYDGIRYQRLSRQFGEEVAISAGLDTAIGDYVVVMLPFMDPPECIPEMVQRAINGVDVVFGVRTSRVHEGIMGRLWVKLFYLYCRRFLKLDLTANSTQFRCLSRQAVNAITQIKDRYRYLRLFSSYVGYSSERFEYEPIYRQGKVRGRGFAHSVRYALALIMENSTHPLRLVSWMGFTAAIGNLVYCVYIFAIYIFKEDVLEGWTTLSLQSAAEFFFISLLLTALCEYMGLMLNRLQARPLYYIREEMNSSVLLVDSSRVNVVDESEFSYLDER
jgi:glycosyltransferase involved in cell wall biosynthesis